MKLLKTYESFEPEEYWEEEDEKDIIGEVNPIFNKFLIDNNIKDKFINNFENRESGIDLMFFLLSYKGNEKGIILGAFSWDETPEKSNYWSYFHNKWKKLLLGINESFEPEEYWEEEYDEILHFNKPIYNKDDIPFKKDEEVYVSSPNGPRGEVLKNEKGYILDIRKDSYWIISVNFYKNIGGNGNGYNWNFSGGKYKAVISKTPSINESFEPEEHWEEYEDDRKLQPNTVYKVKREDWKEFSDLLVSDEYKWRFDKEIKYINPFYSRYSRPYIYIIINTERYPYTKSVITKTTEKRTIDYLIDKFNMDYIEF